MPNVLAMSFEGALTPSFDLLCLQPGKKPPDGWGIGCYPGGEPSALVMKEAAPAQGSIRSALVSTWERLASSIFVMHVRKATWGALTEANTQPFLRPWGRRDWLFGHSGSLTTRLIRQGRFEPVGSTDSEEVMCELLARTAEREWRSIADIPTGLLHAWLQELNGYGALTLALTDGTDLVVYADAKGAGPLYLWEIHPPHEELAFGDDALTVDLTRRGIKSRKGIVVCSSQLESKAGPAPTWRTLEPGSMVVLRQGAIRSEVTVDRSAHLSVPATASSDAPGAEAPVRAARPRPTHPLEAAPTRRVTMLHRTVYEYATPVERSTHLLRLMPMHDRLQSVISCQVTSSVDGKESEFEDVFGNRVKRLLITSPFTRLEIEAKSTVDLLDTNPLDFRPLRVRSTIPLVWMPWQRSVLQPFLLPRELPESELAELTEYAMSFATRNDFDVLDTLLDMNHTIYSEYAYVQGVTNLQTTPFDVYANRRGVCQDFANLFICLARLLSVPARYVCGYVYTGPKHENRAQSDASHAWVQVYLPEVGWKGFDPTNGIMTQTDHLRVAVGRNYVDATPTSGTLFVGGGGEKLAIEVRMDRVEP